MFAQDSVLGSKQRTPIDINRKQAWKILMRVHEARYKIYSPTVNLRTTLFYLAAWNQTSQQIKIWVKQVLEVNSINLQKEESTTMMDTFNSEIGGTDPITPPLSTPSVTSHQSAPHEQLEKNWLHQCVAEARLPDCFHFPLTAQNSRQLAQRNQYFIKKVIKDLTLREIYNVVH